MCIRDRVVGILLPISAFVACGFEHVVANMFFLPMGLLLNSTGFGALGAITAGGIFYNIALATVGNILGGALVALACLLYTSTAYLRCARVYMLVGDLDNAARLLLACLSFAVSPDEIAQAYYQLAYVEWKAGRPREGLACYCKSIMTSMAFAGQSSIELHELMRENNLDPPRPDQVNSILEAVGIPVAPVAERLSEVQGALRAAVDANLFGPARAFLITLLRVQPDDALVNVLRSLEQVLKTTAQDRQ